jgi:hypothetical protein
VRKTLQNLEGAYALAFLFDDTPDQMIVARLGSPLVIGYGAPASDGGFEMFVGSDAVALAPFTSQISYLEDWDVSVLSRGRVLIEDRNGLEVERHTGHRITSALIRNASPCPVPPRENACAELRYFSFSFVISMCSLIFHGSNAQLSSIMFHSQDCPCPN